MGASVAIINKMLNFSGRASRSEYWLFAAPILLLLAFALAYDLIVLGPVISQATTIYTDAFTGEQRVEMSIVTTYGPRTATLIVAVLALLPFSALLTRRVHDIGSPGWHAWLAIAVAFFVGPILSTVVDLLADYSISVALIFGALLGLPQLIISMLALLVIVLWGTTESEPEDNEYGPIPNEDSK